MTYIRQASSVAFSAVLICYDHSKKKTESMKLVRTSLSCAHLGHAGPPPFHEQGIVWNHQGGLPSAGIALWWNPCHRRQRRERGYTRDWDRLRPQPIWCLFGTLVFPLVILMMLVTLMVVVSLKLAMVMVILMPTMTNHHWCRKLHRRARQNRRYGGWLSSQELI